MMQLVWRELQVISAGGCQAVCWVKVTVAMAGKGLCCCLGWEHCWKVGGLMVFSCLAENLQSLLFLAATQLPLLPCSRNASSSASASASAHWGASYSAQVHAVIRCIDVSTLVVFIADFY